MNRWQRKYVLQLFLLLIAFFCFSTLAFCQQVQPEGNKTSQIHFLGSAKPDSGLWAPVGLAIIPYFDSTGRIGYNPTDSELYFHRKKTWVKLLDAAGAGTVTSITYTSPLTGGTITTTGTVGIPAAKSDTNGYMDSDSYFINRQMASTGVYSDAGLIVDAGDTTYSIGAINGWVIDNTGANLTTPVATRITYLGSSDNTPLLANDATYVLINSTGGIVQQATVPTIKERRENIYIGKIVHPDHATITNINNNPDFSLSGMSALRDLWTPIKLINDGIVVSPNGTNLNINTSAGYLYGNGINFIIDPLIPNTVSYPGVIVDTFQYRIQTGGGTFSNTTLIDPANYDNGGTVTPVGSTSKATNQRIYLFPTGVIRIQYGQQVYSSLTNAIAGIDNEPFIVNSNNASTGILIGILSVRENATDLSNTSEAVFRLVSKFGELASGSSGISTTTLQQAYDNSTVPQIITSTTEGSVTIKRGSASDNDTVLSIQNGSGISKFTVNGNGIINYATWGGATIDLTHGGTNATTTTSVNGTPITYGSNNAISVGTGTVTDVIGGTNISISGTSTIQPTVNISGTIGLSNGGTNATTTTSVNGTPITYGSNNTLAVGTGTVTDVIGGTNITITGTSTIQPTVNISGTIAVGNIDTATINHFIWASTWNDITISSAGKATIKTSVNLAGSPTTTTQTAGANNTTVATTAYVETYYKDTSCTYLATVNPVSPVTNKLYPVSYNLTAASGAVYIANTSSTFANGQHLTFYITGTAARGVTYGTQYADAVVKPTTTITTKTLIIDFEWNTSLSEFLCTGTVSQQ